MIICGSSIQHLLKAYAIALYKDLNALANCMKPALIAITVHAMCYIKAPGFRVGAVSGTATALLEYTPLCNLSLRDYSARGRESFLRRYFEQFNALQGVVFNGD